MNQKILLFTIIFVCESLIKSAYDDGSAFTCPKLAVGTGERCLLTDSQCKVHYDSCTGLDQIKCTSNNILFSEPSSKCSMVDGACTKTERLCEEYSIVSNLGVLYKDLKASSDDKICVLKLDNTCTEEDKSAYGCSSTTEGICIQKIPIDGNNKIEPLKKCVESTTCSSELKKCGDHKDLDDCVSLSTSDNTKKRCFLSGSTCEAKNIKCEGYNDDVEDEDERDAEECAAIIPYIIESDNSINVDVYSECKLINKICQKVKKKCEDLDAATCANQVLDDSSKRCVFKSSCIEQFKTCALYNAQTTGKDQTGCEAIEEDSYHKCVFTSGNCENKKKCSDYDWNIGSCNLISLNNTHKCEHTGSECIEQYKECQLYTGNDRKKCESITPPEKNMRCILREDSQCVSVSWECEEYVGAGLNEYECINNYKPLDENNKCVFRNGACLGIPKYEYEYCSYYLGADPTICGSIKPKNKGENYSIKCSIVDGKC